MNKRQAYVQRVEKQCQISRDLYELIDTKIKILDNSISIIINDSNGGSGSDGGGDDELNSIKNSNNNILNQTKVTGRGSISLNSNSNNKKRKYVDNSTMKAQLKAVVGASFDSLTSSNEPVYCTCK